MRLAARGDAWKQMFPVIQLASTILANNFPALGNPYMCRVIQHDSVAEVRFRSEFLPKPAKEILGL